MKEQNPLSAFMKGIQQQPAFSRKGRCLSILLGLLAAGGTITAQTYTPLAVTGYTQDIVAESGTSSLALTSTVIDGSNYVLYTKTFTASNTSVSYGLPNNGTIVNGTRTYQLEPYTTNNALYLSYYSTPAPANSAVSGTLTLVTPAILSKISVLLLSTEVNAIVKATLNYTDGTTTTTANATLPDWFAASSTTYPAMISGIGRIQRLAAPPYSTSLSGSNSSSPSLFAWDIPVPCASQGKRLQSVTFTAVGYSGTSTSRAVIMALSGAAYTPPIVTLPTVTPPQCGTNSGFM